MTNSKAAAVLATAIALTGCNATSALTGLVGSKSGITTQAGAENVKQTVGLTSKADTSSKQETIIKESDVKEVDTSSKKHVNAPSITAQTIKADTIKISGNGEDGVKIAAIFTLVGFMAGAFVVAMLKKKNA